MNSDSERVVYMVDSGAPKAINSIVSNFPVLSPWNIAVKWQKLEKNENRDRHGHRVRALI